MYLSVVIAKIEKTYKLFIFLRYFRLPKKLKFGANMKSNIDAKLSIPWSRQKTLLEAYLGQILMPSWTKLGPKLVQVGAKLGQEDQKLGQVGARLGHAGARKG